MKTQFKLVPLVLLCASLLEPSTSMAQGGLTPPGPPAPTMMTLAQIEPRTPIAATPFTISVPGSYYLTSNLTVSGVGINITTNNVTLDLNGFTMSTAAAAPPGSFGILLSGTLAHIHILNGHIRGDVTYSGGVYSGGFWNGISYGNTPSNVRVTGVSVSGCLYNGIYLGFGPAIVVESCTVRTVGGYGIYATRTSRSTANECGSYAIYTKIATDCSGSSTGGYGLFAGIASNCEFSGNDGIKVSIADNCIGSCWGTGATVALSAGVATNCNGDNASPGSGIGLKVDHIAIGCGGSSIDGTGIQGYLLNSCRGIGPTPVIASYRYDMP